MQETVRAEQWLFQTLGANATLAALGIYSEVIPEKASLPAVVFKFQSGSDYKVVGAIRVWADMVYLVEVTGEVAGYAALQAYADLIDSLLHDKSGSVADGVILECEREAPHAMTEIEDGRQFRHLGGFFRLKVQ